MARAGPPHPHFIILPMTSLNSSFMASSVPVTITTAYIFYPTHLAAPDVVELPHETVTAGQLIGDQRLVDAAWPAD